MAANLEVLELPENRLDIWDRLNSTSQQATVFSSREFSLALKKVTGQGYTFLVCLKGDDPLAGIPIYSSTRAGVRTAHQPPLVPHLGLILSSRLGEKHPRSSESRIMRSVESLSGWLAERFDYVSLSHHPSLADARPFAWQGYRDRTCYTYRIELSDFGMNSLHSSVRKQVAKGEREGLELVRSEDTATIIDLVGMSYGKHGRGAPFAGPYLEALFKELDQKKKAELWYARDREGRLVSARMLIESGDVIYDWVAGADPSQYESGATSFLLYHLIARSRERFRVFDLMGANTPSIAVFKSNFGGLVTPYHLTSKAMSLKGSFALLCLGLLGRRRGT